MIIKPCLQTARLPSASLLESDTLDTLDTLANEFAERDVNVAWA